MRGLTVIEASGDGDRIGCAIADATADAGPTLARLVRKAAKRHPPGDEVVRHAVQDLRQMLLQYSPSTLAQIEAMALGYQLPADELLIWLLGTYFRSIEATQQGCSVYARGGADSSREPWLVKNRDTDPQLENIQTLLRVKPTDGYAWAALSTAGAPDVHSAGMNEHGLAVADTHVPSSDIGIGLPRFSLMMHILQSCTSVEESVAYLRSVPRMGFGNLVLADAAGSVAVVECGHSHVEVLPTTADYVVATNHFISPSLAPTCLRKPESSAGADSRDRRRRMDTALAQESLDAETDPISVVTDHKSPGATCIHSTGKKESVTVATVVFFPTRGVVRVGVGTPCVSRMRDYTVLSARQDGLQRSEHAESHQNCELEETPPEEAEEARSGSSFRRHEV